MQGVRAQGLSAAFARGNYAAACEAVVRLRYLQRILDAVDERL